MPNTINTETLAIAYEAHGRPDGWPVVLLHGFPYDIHAFDVVAPMLAEQGARAYVPYLRGYGPTRFLSAATPRSGEQAALGRDLRDFLDAMRLPDAVLAGYDWGGRAACIVAALWPARARALVSYNSYNIQDIAAETQPRVPEAEWRLWYQFYLHGERGRRGLEQNRAAFARLLWQLWSPSWRFTEDAFARTAVSFDNPDFVDVVVHSYRHRYGLAQGDPACAETEAALARQPRIGVPSVTLDGADDGIRPEGTAGHGKYFTGPHEHRVIAGAGHNLPQENPQEFAAAVMRAVQMAKR